MIEFTKLVSKPTFDKRGIFKHITYETKSIFVDLTKLFSVEKEEDITKLFKEYPERFPKALSSGQEFSKLTFDNKSEIVVLEDYKYITSKCKTVLLG